MKNLTTRKIVLGLLVTLVLAFSVQVTADALSFGTTRTNDLQTIVRGNTFSVTFAVTLEDDVRKSAYADYIVDPNDATRYFLDSTSGDKDNDQYDSGEPTVSTANAFHYNNEAVRISVSGAGAKITSIGTNTITPASSITVKEGGSSAEALAEGDIVVNCSTSSHGEVTITASDATPSEDYPSGVRKAPSFVLTTYVTQYTAAVGATRTIRLVGVTNGVAIGYDDQRDQPIYNGDSSHYPVTYRITGSGTIYIKEGDRGASDLTNRFGNAGTPLTTSTAAKILLDMGGSTNTIIATLGGSYEESQGIYIFGNPQLSITEGDGQSGNPNAPLTNALQITLKDNAGTPAGVAGVPIKFDVTDKSPSGGILSKATGTTIVDASNEEISSPIPGSTMYVRTNTSGQASITFQLGTIPGEQTVTVSALNIARLTKTIKATATGTAATRQLFAEDIDRQGTTNIYTLVARVENGGQADPNETVTFTTTKGLLTGRNSDDSDDLTAKTVYAKTNAGGKARVTYNAGDSSGTLEVVASISVGTTVITQLQEVTFNVRGGSSSQPQQPQQPQQTTTNSITISPSSTTGDPGDTVTVNVSSSPTGTLVTLSSNEFANTNFSPQSGLTPFSSTLTLPSSTGSYSFFAVGSIAGATVSDSATVTVAAAGLGTLTISPAGAAVNGVQNVTITARDADGDVPADAFTVTLSGTGFTTTTATVLGGSVTAPVRLPTTAGTYTLTASATGYNSGTTRLVVGGQTTTPGTTPIIPTGTTGEPDSLDIDGQRLRSGVVNEQLDAPLRVRVIDVNGRGVSGVRVTFRVLNPARGTFAGARGRGNAILDETDRNGYASADFTPTSTGDVVVRASASGVSPVTFILDINGVSETTTDTRTPGPGVTPSREISPVVHVGAANRPPMLWVDGGKIYALVGTDVQEFASGVEGAMNVAIGGRKVYWTEQTGQSSGTINSANLDGTGVTELTSIMAVPMGIAVDGADSKLYWTNSRGRIQRANLDGSKIQNVLQNLPSPMDIALLGGNAYWTQGGNVQVVNLSGTKRIRNISTGADAAMSLAISGGKVYWTERTGQSAGTINRANLDGSAVTQLTSIKAVPMGIAVDGSRRKIFWTNSRGRVQSANLDGSKIQNVVDGLGMPGDMLLSNSIAAPAATTTTTTTTTPTTANYDVDGSGSVDNVDVFLVALAVGTTTAKYDVNGDGTVDDKDIALVRDNRNEGAAAAPMIVGMKLSADQIGRLQEQIDLLVASSDRSPATLKTLVYLQQLIATARPEKTQLLANYPNPFNPETWIPYELATDTNVHITIYNTQGVVIRTLALGHQSAGYYTGRDRAAYWDGRNALGEQVASGIYFYQFETDEMSSMRKMVILK